MYRKIILLGFFLTLFHAFSQDSPEATAERLDTVILTGHRLYPLTYSLTPVTPIRVEENLFRHTGRIEDLISGVPGLEIRRRGTGDIQSDVYIQGGHYEQTGIAIDGVPLNDLQSGHHNMNLPLPVQAIGQIEIIKGPAARIFGQNAMTGMLRFKTRDIDRDSILVQLTGGAFGTYGWAVSGSRNSGDSGVLFAFDRKVSDGYRYNSDYRIHRYFMKYRTGTANISAAFARRAFGANGFYASPDYKDQYEETQTAFISASYDILSENSKWTHTVFWKFNHDDYVFLRYNPAYYHNVHSTHLFGYKTDVTVTGKLGTSGLGLEILPGVITSSNLGDHRKNAIRLYAEQDMKWKKFRFQPGMVLSYESDFGVVFLPGINAGYKLSPHVWLYTDMGLTSRNPTYTERFYNSPAESGNPDLEPERASGIHTGAHIHTGKLEIRPGIFYRKVNQAIDWVRDEAQDKWMCDNIDEVTAQGAGCYFRYSASGKYLSHRWEGGYSYLDESAGTQTRYFLHTYKHLVSLNWKTDYRKFLSGSLRYEYRAFPGGEETHLLNATGVLRTRTGTWSITAYNLLDFHYTGANLVPMPGRHLMLTWSAGL